MFLSTHPFHYACCCPLILSLRPLRRCTPFPEDDGRSVAPLVLLSPPPFPHALFAVARPPRKMMDAQWHLWCCCPLILSIMPVAVHSSFPTRPLRRCRACPEDDGRSVEPLVLLSTYPFHYACCRTLILSNTPPSSFVHPRT